MNQKPPPPFSCTYTPQVPALLHGLGCSIALSTYQAGKVVFLSAKDEQSLSQLPRNFEKAMGVAEDPETDRLAIACLNQVLVFRNSQQLAAHYPKSPNVYDAMYMPRAAYFTGPLDIHDVHFDADGGLIAVNTLFSCLMKVDDAYNFTPVWQPHFVDRIAPEDRCHLNGLAMEDGRPRYVTAFNQGNERHSWRENITKTGIVMDVESNTVLAEGLAMPHSPTLINGELYVLTSATGELVRMDRTTGEKEVIASFGGFVRGMSFHEDYLFIGLSKIREKSKTFGMLAGELTNNQAGIAIFHLPTRSKVGVIQYQSSVEEIYDVHVIKGKRKPNIINPKDPVHADGVTLPDTTFWRQPAKESND
jgi:uncharacterized protein (TIGR03032 family)